MDEFFSIMDQRRMDYLILRDLFANKPTMDYLGALSENNILELLSDFGIEELACAKAKLLTLQEQILNNEISKDCLPEQQYYDLFFNPKHMLAPPWESSYSHPDGLLFQESTFAVRKFYLKYRFISAGFPHEPDDHLVTELDFMIKLINLYINNAERQKKVILDQVIFLENHLLKWVPLLSIRIHSYSNGTWYHALIDYLTAFLNHDFQRINNDSHYL